MELAVRNDVRHKYRSNLVEDPVVTRAPTRNGLAPAVLPPDGSCWDCLDEEHVQKAGMGMQAL